MFLGGGRILISSQRVIQILKKKKLIPHWISDDSPLPPDPDNILIFIHKQSTSELPCHRQHYLDYMEKFYMNYSQMTEAVREGAHARRNTWKQGEKLWSDGKILIHNTPYFGEPFNQGIQGYVYVCEQVDVFATDWELVGA